MARDLTQNSRKMKVTISTKGLQEVSYSLRSPGKTYPGKIWASEALTPGVTYLAG